VPRLDHPAMIENHPLFPGMARSASTARRLLNLCFKQPDTRLAPRAI
jgi:hypothetical protein